MGLNQNHTVEEIGSVRCAVVEKNITPKRAEFLTELLNGNGFTVICAPTAPAKSAKKPVAEGQEADSKVAEEIPESASNLFTLGVTNVTFNPINAIYGRILTNKEGRIVTPDFWFQKDAISHDDKPYFKMKQS